VEFRVVGGGDQTEDRSLLGMVAGPNIGVNQVKSASLNILAQKSYMTTSYIVISLNHRQHKYMHTLFNIVRIDEAAFHQDIFFRFRTHQLNRLPHRFGHPGEPPALEEPASHTWYILLVISFPALTYCLVLTVIEYLVDHLIS
jgi:hypothetical protein